MTLPARIIRMGIGVGSFKALGFLLFGEFSCVFEGFTKGRTIQTVGI